MIARPGAWVNEGVRWAADELAAAAGLDFVAGAANVAAWGGQPWIFRAALAAGVRSRPPADRATVAQLGLLAGWRAGVLELRTEALAAAAALADRDLGELAAAVLGLPADRLSAFLAGQQDSVLAWPGLPRTAVVHRVGGFVGLGGVWLAPPVTAIPGSDGSALVRCADDTWWVLRADVFGSRLVRREADAPRGPDAAVSVPGGTPLEPPGSTPGLLVWPSSYLVRVTGEAW